MFANKKTEPQADAGGEVVTLPARPSLVETPSPEEYLKVLPADHKAYTDKYFLRTNEILKAEGLNPVVRAQLFIRKGPGEFHGINETVAMLKKYSNFFENGGKVFALPEGTQYQAKETLVVLEGHVQDLIELETMYLGAISSQTTKANEPVTCVNTTQVACRMKEIVTAAGGRPVTYFGARHWHYSEDEAINAAAKLGMASGSSTDVGAALWGKAGEGTIPHALENIYAWKYGKEVAVAEATKAFDRQIDPAVRRIALIDYNNREIDDSIATAQALGENLYAVRVDTCGENIAQGALTGPNDPNRGKYFSADLPLPAADAPEAKYWYGNGVTVTGVLALRQSLDAAGYENVKMFLTSGFGSVNKVKAFVEAEKVLGVKLFDALGVGGVYSPVRTTTMDIVAVGDTAETMQPISKVGRPYRPNARLQEVKDPFVLEELPAASGF